MPPARWVLLLFNNVAVSPRRMRSSTTACAGVAIADSTLHHANGTEDIFRDESRR